MTLVDTIFSTWKNQYVSNITFYSEFKFTIKIFLSPTIFVQRHFNTAFWKQVLLLRKLTFVKQLILETVYNYNSLIYVFPKVNNERTKWFIHHHVATWRQTSVCCVQIIQFIITSQYFSGILLIRMYFYWKFRCQGYFSK